MPTHAPATRRGLHAHRGGMTLAPLRQHPCHESQVASPHARVVTPHTRLHAHGRSSARATLLSLSLHLTRHLPSVCTSEGGLDATRGFDAAAAPHQAPCVAPCEPPTCHSLEAYDTAPEGAVSATVGAGPCHRLHACGSGVSAAKVLDVTTRQHPASMGLQQHRGVMRGFDRGTQRLVCLQCLDASLLLLLLLLHLCLLWRLILLTGDAPVLWLWDVLWRCTPCRKRRRLDNGRGLLRFRSTSRLLLAPLGHRHDRPSPEEPSSHGLDANGGGVAPVVAT